MLSSRCTIEPPILTVCKDIVNESGELILSKGQKIKPAQYNWTQEWYGDFSGTYYPARIRSVILEGIYGAWELDVFEEFQTASKID